MIFVLLSLTAGCSQEAVVEEPAYREPVAYRYAAVPELKVHARPEQGSTVVSTWSQGNTVPVLAIDGQWAEVRLGSGESGWVLMGELAEDRDSAIPRSEPGAPRFRVPPEAVFSQTRVSGEIVLEANVSDQGNVSDIRTLRNTTGSAALEARNREALRKAKFHPMYEGGRAIPFVYEYRASY